MAVISTQCPHCRVRHVSCNVRATMPFPDNYMRSMVLVQCQACAYPFAALMAFDVTAPNSDQGHKLISHYKMLSAAIANTETDLGRIGIRPVEVYPAAPSADVPEGCPPEVIADFEEGKANILDGRYKSGVSSLRDVLEAALKTFPEAVGNMSLYQRIDALAAAGRLAPDLRNWAHTVRLLGNEATHEGRPSKEKAEDFLHLVEMIFQYLFSLPAKVKELRGTDPAQ